MLTLRFVLWVLLLVVANKNLLDLSPTMWTVVGLQELPQFILPRGGAEVDMDIARCFELIDRHCLVDFDGDIPLLFEKNIELLEGRPRVDDFALNGVLTNDDATARIIFGIAPVNQDTQEVRDTVQIRHFALELRTVLQSDLVCAGWNCGASIDLLLALARNPARGIRTTIGKFTNYILDSVTEKCAVNTEVADSIFRTFEFAS